MSNVDTPSVSEFDAGLFSPEELALMNQADGVVDGLTVEHDARELQAQFAAVARLVAEGCERERQLRSLIADLTLLAKTSEAQQRSICEQTQNLARIVLSSAERELQFQASLQSLRATVIGRAKSAT